MDDIWDWHISPHAGPIRGWAKDERLVAALRLQRYWRWRRVLPPFVEGTACIAWVRREYKHPVTLCELGEDTWVARRDRKHSFFFLPHPDVVLLTGRHAFP